MTTQGIELGSLLVSLLEPVPGKAAEFHRWYERDHFYAGCMVGRWFFAGRRYVATRAHKALRYPAVSPLVEDPRKGSYLALYYLLAGHHDEAVRWAVDQVNWLHTEGRMPPLREQVLASFYRYDWGAFRDQDGVPAELSLHHSYAGVVMVVVDRDEQAQAAELERWYREQHLPAALAGSPAAMCLAFHPVPLPADAPAYVKRPPGDERRSLHLYFLEDDPLAVWPKLFADHGRSLSATGLGEVSFAAGFVPTIPGSDRYVDEI